MFKQIQIDYFESDPFSFRIQGTLIYIRHRHEMIFIRHIKHLLS